MQEVRSTDSRGEQESTAAEADHVDVFAAARWFDALWNSDARAVAPDLIEWQCRTYGSGRGRAYWEFTAVFDVVIAAFDLDTDNNYDGRDELIVRVPLHHFGDVVSLVDRLGDEADAWPWFEAEEADEQVAMAAETLALPAEAITGNPALRQALRIG